MKSKLIRKTTSTSFIPEIDGLRFLAIITVVLYHLNTAYSREVGFGTDLGISALGGREHFLQLGWWVIRFDLGVKIFFSISGFVLALPFLKRGLLGEGKSISLKDYFMRRLTRLEPPFITSLIFFLGVHVAVLGENLKGLMPHFWAGLVYAHVFIYGEPNPINPVTWSLETEAQFYVLVPVLFWIIFNLSGHVLRWIVLLLIFTLSIYLKSYFSEHGILQLTSSIFAYFSNFITGILFAYLYVSNNSQWFKHKSFWFDIIGVCCLFFSFYFYKPQAYWLNNLLLNLSVFGILLTAFKGVLWNWFYTLKWVYIIGGMCYSIYLLHYALFHFLVKFTGKITSGMGYKIDYLIQIIINIPILLLISIAFYRLIERPCMDKDWPKNLFNWVKTKTSH